MKKIILLLITLLSCSLASNNASDFLMSGMSSRALAMGNAFTAMSANGDSLFFNPAAPAVGLENTEYTTSAINNFEDVSRKTLGWLSRLNNFGFDNNSVVGFVYNSEEVQNIPKTSWQDDRPLDEGSFDSGKHNLTVSFSNEYNHNIYYGLNLKHYSYFIGDYSAQGLGLDLGFLYKVPENFLNSPVVLGLALHNLNRTKIAWSTGHSDSIPFRINLGATTFKSIFGKKFVLSADLEQEEYQQILFRAGSEYWLVNNMFALRGGIDGKNLTMGAGFKYQGVAIDFAQANLGDLGFVKRITLSYAF